MSLALEAQKFGTPSEKSKPWTALLHEKRTKTAYNSGGVNYQDFAIALFDELERPVHPRQRFTVGY